MSIKAIRAYIRQLSSDDEALRCESADGLAKYGPLASDALPGLINCLGHASVSVKARAANALGRIGPAAQDAVGQLVGLLADSSVGLRQAAAKALARIGPVAVPQLLDSLRYGELQDRIQAARALAALGEDAAIAAATLSSALSDAEPTVRAAVAQALAAINADVSELLPLLQKIIEDEPPVTRPALIVALSRFEAIAHAGVPMLVAMITAEPVEARPLAIQALGKLGAIAVPAIPALLALQADETSPLRSAALIALGRIGPSAAQAVPELLKWLSTAGEKRVQLIAQTLGYIGEAAAAAVPALIAHLEQAYGETREILLSALARIGPPALPALPLLQKLAQDTAAPVRAQATRTIGYLGKDARSAALPLLKEALGDSAAIVRLAAVEALGRLRYPPKSIPEDFDHLLKDRSPEVRRATARLMGKLRISPTSRKTEFRRALNSPYSQVRYDAAEFLWHLTGSAKDSLEVWKEAIVDEDRAVRLHTMDLLVDAGRKDPRAVAILVQALNNPDEPLGRPAATALIRLRDKATDALKPALTSPNRALRGGALYILGRLGTAGHEAIPELLKLLDDSEAEVRWGAARVLAEAARRQPDVAAGPLARLLADDNPAVRAWTALALSRLGTPAIAAIVPQAGHDSPAVRVAACAALTYFGEDALPALPAIGRCLGDKNSDVVKAANRAIDAMSQAVRPEMAPHIELLASPHSGYRAFAAEQIRAFGVRGLPVVIQTLIHRKPITRIEAASIISRLGEQAVAAVPLLVNGLGDSNERVRESMIRTLVSIGAAAVSGLTAALTHPKARVRATALDAIFRIGPPAVTCTPQLIGVILNDADLAVQRFAAEALGRVCAADTSGLMSLVQALPEASSAGQVRLLRAIAVIGQPAAAARPAMIHLLKSGEAEVRRHAIHALGQVGLMPEDVSQLVAALADRDASVRQFACRALVQAGSEAVSALVEQLTSSDEQPSVVTPLGELLPRNPEVILPLLLPLAKQAEPGIQASALRALGHAPAESLAVILPILQNALHAPTTPIRLAAVQSLAMHKGSQVEALLRTVVTQPSNSSPIRSGIVRRTAFKALIDLRVPDAISLCAEGLNDADWGIAVAAVNELLKAGPAAAPAIPALVRALSSKLQQVREPALKALTPLDPEGVHRLAGLSEAMITKNFKQMAWAVEHLGQLGEKALPCAEQIVLLVPEYQGGVSQKAINTLKAIGAKAIPAFKAMLTHKTPAFRNRALNAISRFDWSLYNGLQSHRKHLNNPPADVAQKIDRTLKQILTAAAPSGDGLEVQRAKLKDKSNWHIRFNAAIALGKMGAAAAKAVPDLVRSCNDSDYDVREKSAEALGLIGVVRTNVIDKLTGLLKDRHEKPRNAALLALCRLGQVTDDALRSVLKFLEDSNSPDKLRRTCTLIAKLSPKPAPALPLLVRLLEHKDPDVQTFAAWTIGKFGRDGAAGLPELTRLLRSPHPRVRAWAAGAYYRVTRDLDAVLQPLISVLACREPDVWLAVADAVEEIGLMGVEAVEPLLKHEQPAMREAAVFVLGQLGPQARAVAGLLEPLATDPDEQVRKAVQAAVMRLTAKKPTPTDFTPADEIKPPAENSHPAEFASDEDLTEDENFDNDFEDEDFDDD